MANELAAAYVAIVPSLRGASKQITSQLSGVDTTAVGSTLGKQLSGAMGKSFDLKAVGAKFEQAGSQISAAGEKLSNKFTKPFLVGATVAAGAAALIGKSALSAYATWEQAVGGVETLFKDSAPAIKKYADQAYKSAGMSANDYMGTVTSFSASLIGSLGGNTKKAAEIANRAIIDMSDNANKMGTGIGDIQNAYQGFAKQNYTMLDNLKLGYGGTQQEMKRLLEDATKLSGVKYEIGSFADIISAIGVVQDELGITGTTALEAASTIDGSVASMKSSWSNWLTELGKDNADMAGATKNLAGTISIAGQNISTRLKQIFKGLGAALPEIWASLKESLPATFDPLIQKIEAVVGWFNGLDDSTKQAIAAFAATVVAIGPVLMIVGKLVTGIGLLISAGSAVAGVIGTVSGAITLLKGGAIVATPAMTSLAGAFTLITGPVGIIIAAVAALTAGLVYFFTQTETGKAMWDQIWAGIKATWDTVSAAIIAGFDAFVAWLTPMMAEISEAWAVIWDKIQMAWEVIGPPLMAAIGIAVELMKNNIQTVLNVLKAIWDTVWNQIKIAVETVMGVIQGIVKTVTSLIKGDWEGAWQGVKQIFTTIVNAVVNTAKNLFTGMANIVLSIFNGILSNISSVVNGIKNFITIGFTSMKDSAVNLFTKMKDGTIERAESMLDFVKSIPGKISDFFSNAPTMLKDAGKKVIDGFLDGITGGFTKVKNKLGELTSLLPDWKGPAETDRTILVKSGQLVVGGFVKGLESQYGQVEKSLLGLTSDVGSFGRVELAASGSAPVSAMSAVPAVVGGADGAGLSRSDLDYVADRIVSGLTRIAEGAGLASDWSENAERFARAI